MSFLASGFLWALVGLLVPIIIALWSRRKRLPIQFGGFYILKKIIPQRSRTWVPSQIIKLINRLILIASIVFIFANPMQPKVVISSASDGFAIVLDVSRVMQWASVDGPYLAEVGLRETIDLLKTFPPDSRGLVLGLSSKCQPMDRQSVKSASEWLEQLTLQSIPFTNDLVTQAGFSSCFSLIDDFFSGQSIFKALISPVQSIIGKETLLGFSKVIHLKPKTIESIQREVTVTKAGESFLVRGVGYRASLIKGATVEPIGVLAGDLNLPASSDSVLWLTEEGSLDAWGQSKLIRMSSKLSKEVYLWAEKETPGFISLYTALKNYPDLKVVRSIGTPPVGSVIISYGKELPENIQGVRKEWIFLNPQAEHLIDVRDQKVMTQKSHSSDVEKSFMITTQDGRITVRRYLILDLLKMRSLESFDDGAPALLVDEKNRWISPFDLEDLTTDLVLEPTFIPYLYRKLELFLEDESDNQLALMSKPLWLIKGMGQASSSVLRGRKWPGVYESRSGLELEEPLQMPKAFYDVLPTTHSMSETSTILVSLRNIFFTTLLFSIIVELLICAAQARGWLAAFLVGLLFSASTIEALETRPIPVGYLEPIDSDRKKALEQIVVEYSRLSNLDFQKPQSVRLSDIWKYPVIIVSREGRWGPFSRDEREQIRAYLEQGGLFVFDDPLALPETVFHQSVKDEIASIFSGRKLSKVSRESVVFRSYYLLEEVSGRKLASPNLEGLEFDRRWVALFSSNDLLGSQLKSSSGDYAFSVSPYGQTQRQLARRLLLNILMYALTLDYKDDSIHLPHILKRRVK